MSTGNEKIPDGWRLARLGDVITLQRGIDLPVQDRLNGAIPVYGSNGVLGYHSNASQSGPGVITGRSGSIGLVYYSEGPYWPLNTTLYVRDFHGNNERYVCHFLGHLGLERFAASTGVPSLNRNFVHPHLVVIPPPAEQQAIAAVLDSIDDAIEGTEAVIVAMERLRDALLHELLTRGVPGWHSAWKEVPGIGTIPASWDVVRLGEVAEAVTSGSRAWSRYFSPDGALFVRSQNISGGTIDRSDSIFVQPPADVEAVRTRIYQSDILVSITGEPGNIAVADDTLGQAYVSQHVALVRLSDPELSSFAGEFLRGRAGQNQFRGMVYGQTRPGLSLINVKRAKVAIPSPSERNLIADTGKSLHTAIKEHRSERDRLQSLKASASDALLTGRVRVDSGLQAATR